MLFYPLQVKPRAMRLKEGSFTKSAHAGNKNPTPDAGAPGFSRVRSWRLVVRGWEAKNPQPLGVTGKNVVSG